MHMPVRKDNSNYIFQHGVYMYNTASTFADHAIDVDALPTAVEYNSLTIDYTIR